MAGGLFVLDVLATNALDLVFRGFEVAVGDQDDVDIVTFLRIRNHLPFLVQQVGRHLHRQLRNHAAGILFQRIFFDDAQDRQRERIDAADIAMAVAARAHAVCRLAERGTQALARHLEQAEARNAADLHPCTVFLHRLFQTVFDLALVARGRHVDEVNDEETAEVAQPQLARNLLRRLQVGIQRGFLDIGALGRACRVDVDRGQCLGVVNHDGAARWQAQLATECRFDLRLDLVAREQRHFVFIQAQLAQVLGHHLLDELLGLFEGLRTVDHDLADISPQVITNRADDHVAFLVDQERGLAFAGGLFDCLPELQQIIEVPLQFFGVLAHTSGTYDQAHSLGDLEYAHRFAQFGTILALDATRYAARTRIVRHQHEVAAGQRQESGQCGPFVAALLFLDLDDDFLAFLQQLVDIAFACFERIVVEVQAGDLFHRQEAVPVGAVIDKGGLEAGFHAGDATLVDVGFFHLPAGRFDIEVIQLLTIDDGHAQLFWLSCVDQHALHYLILVAPSDGQVNHGLLSWRTARIAKTRGSTRAEVWAQKNRARAKSVMTCECQWPVVLDQLPSTSGFSHAAIFWRSLHGVG